MRQKFKKLKKNEPFYVLNCLIYRADKSGSVYSAVSKNLTGDKQLKRTVADFLSVTVFLHIWALLLFFIR